MWRYHRRKVPFPRAFCIICALGEDSLGQNFVPTIASWMFQTAISAFRRNFWELGTGECFVVETTLHFTRGGCMRKRNSTLESRRSNGDLLGS